ncbi:unnamed protein product [Blepharisma stoltei]|uniref:Receptor ligand binding region domain-containing protein n=1 Tax=Blepharisma stoltei TaxID=1481888 RepID=A0AAU9JSW2_9CILI|nr:unnamed protein product [Blepharisma stoltei]
MTYLMSVLFCLVASQYTTVPILYSKFTPELIRNAFSKNYNCLEISSQKCTAESGVYYVLYEVNSHADIEALIAALDFAFAFDGTFSLSMASLISDYAKSYEFVHLVYGYNPEKSQNFVHYSEPSYISIRDTALSFIKSSGWQKAVALLGQEFQGMDFQVNNEIYISLQCIVPNLISYDAILLIFAKQIKPLGVKIIIIATNENTTILVQRAIVEAEMNKADYAFIFINHSVWTAYLEGSILISDDNYVASSEENYLEYLIDSFSLLIKSLMYVNKIQGAFSGCAINNYMNNVVKKNSKSYLYNIKNSKKVLCGYMNGNSVQVNLPFIFPGNSMTAPDNTKIKIPISAYGGASNPDGTYYVENALSLTGAIYAVYDINEKHEILSNFELSILNISNCGASIFEYDYCYDCLKAQSENIGYFHLTDLKTVITQGTIEIFRSLNLSTPVLGIQTAASMSNLTYYPQYARVSYPNTVSGSYIAWMLYSLGITKVSLLCTNATWGTDFKEQFESQSKQFNMKILNLKRLVPLGYNGIDKSFIQEIIDVKSRYLVMEVISPDYLSVIEAFYDVGVRKGDLYLYLADLVIDFSHLNETEIGTEVYIKRKELMNGLLYFEVLTYYGSVGERLKTKLFQTYGAASDIMCLYYDATYLGANALDTLISLGINLNSSMISKTIRNIKFTGCSGKVQIDKYGNDRSSIVFGIYNLVQVNSSWTMRLCGIYDPYNVAIYQIIYSFSWFYENNGILPSDIVGADFNCPFKQRESKSFLYGYLLLAGIGTFPLIFGTFLAIKYFNFIFMRDFPMLDSEQEETLLDTWIYISMIIEGLQYIAIGPDFTGLLPDFSEFIKFSIFDIRGSTKDFWDQILLIYIIAAIWVILLIQRIFNIREKCKILSISAIDELEKYCLPTIGDLLFIPFVNFLLMTFQCTNSIGDELKDSYHNQDCNVFCWRETHLKYAVSSSIILLLYLPASLYFRPMWKDETEDLVFHIREQPFHSVIKSFWQILLIELHIILLPASEISYNICCFVIISLFAGLWFIKKPYNYHRASMWYLICLTDCLWLWICQIFSQLDITAAQCLLAFGWVFSVVAGICLQKKYLPSLLVRPKGQDIHKLFKFQLSRRTPSQAGIDNSVKYKYVEGVQKEDLKSSDYSYLE